MSANIDDQYMPPSLVERWSCVPEDVRCTLQIAFSSAMTCPHLVSEGRVYRQMVGRFTVEIQLIRIGLASFVFATVANRPSFILDMWLEDEDVLPEHSRPSVF